MRQIGQEQRATKVYFKKDKAYYKRFDKFIQKLKFKKYGKFQKEWYIEFYSNYPQFFQGFEHLDQIQFKKKLKLTLHPPTKDILQKETELKDAQSHELQGQEKPMNNKKIHLNNEQKVEQIILIGNKEEDDKQIVSQTEGSIIHEEKCFGQMQSETRIQDQSQNLENNVQKEQLSLLTLFIKSISIKSYYQ